MTTAATRSTRATTKFRYVSKREMGEHKTLVTVRLEDSLLDELAKIGNGNRQSMSTTIRAVLWTGVDIEKKRKARRNGSS